MFKYRLITRNGSQFDVEEESGALLYQTRELLKLLKDRYPEVVFTKLKGRLTQPELGNLDLVLVTPRRPPTALLGQLIEGYLIQVLNSDDPELKVRLAKHELKINLCGSKHGEVGGETVLEDRFETSSKKLVAIVRMESIDTSWVRGTSARATPETRFGFFISVREDEVYNGRRGTVITGRRESDDD